MANTNHLDIINGIIGTLRESDALNDILLGDPGIKAADSGLEEIMEKVSSHIPDDLYSDLSEAVTSYVSAHIDPVLLFGILPNRRATSAAVACSWIRVVRRMSSGVCPGRCLRS